MSLLFENYQQSVHQSQVATIPHFTSSTSPKIILFKSLKILSVMAASESGRTTRVVLDEMNVHPPQNPSSHVKFGPSNLVGQYKVVKNSETGNFEPYDGNEEEPEFPKIIISNPGRTKLKEGTQALGEYVPYYEKKQEFFARWICDYYKNNLESDWNYNLPNFICFGSRLADALITPCKYSGKWDFHAARFRNSIFLWADPGFFQEHLTTKLGYGFSFEALMTGADPTTLPTDFMNEKSFAVHERKFGKFSLLLVSDIDAEDEKSNWVEFKMYDQGCVHKIEGFKNPSDKTLKCWSQCVVSNSQRVIIGLHDEEGYLVGMRDRTLPEFEKMIHMSQKGINSCYEFLERLLDFITNQFSQDDPECAKQFLWKSEKNKNNQKVKCIQVPAEDIPIWFKEICDTFTQNGSRDSNFVR